MRAVVVYESMYGNTRAIAEAIGAGISGAGQVSVVPVASASPDLVRDADLIVVGGPTHVHGMSRPATRASAAATAGQPLSELALQPGADGPGVREWLAGLGHVSGACAAFDTRMRGPALLTGRASRAIATRLSRAGLNPVAAPRSFLVTKANELVPGQAARAREWGALLAGKAAVSGAVTG
jgi:hypothetical protein